VIGVEPLADVVSSRDARGVVWVGSNIHQSAVGAKEMKMNALGGIAPTP